MKIMISIEHPAWIHQFKYIIETLQTAGNEVIVLAIDKDGDLELLKSFGIDYVLLAGSSGKNIFEKGCLFLWLSLKYTLQSFKYHPDLLIGRASPMMAVASFFSNKKHLVFEDTEVSKFSLKICKALSSRIITSTSFLTNLGAKQKRVDTYKELFYLHPSIFVPDSKVLLKYGFNLSERFIVVRFVAWNASHDFGLSGLTDGEKLRFVQELQPFARVYISSEVPVSQQLEKYRLTTPYTAIHHVLYYAALFVGEGASMASESVILGTHAIYMNPIESGSTIEQSDKYHLLFPFNDRTKSRYTSGLAKAKELLSLPDLEEQGKVKRAELIKNKVDINRVFLDEMYSL